MNKEQLLELIAGDQLEEALDAIRQLVAETGRNDLRNAQVELSGRLNHYESRLRAGTDDPDDLERERNRIRKALRELTDLCFTPPAHPGFVLQQQISRWRWPLLIVLLSVIAVGVGMLPVKEAHFEATLLSSDVAFRLEGAMKEPMSFRVSRCALMQLSKVRGSGWHQEMDEEMPEPLEIYLDSSEMELKLNAVPPKAAQHLRARGNDLTISLLDGGNGELQIYSDVNMQINPEGAPRLAAQGELLEWTAEPGAELNFSLPPGDTTFLWERTPVQSVTFEQRLLGQADAKSAILSGTLTVGKQMAKDLEKGDYLDLSNLRDAVIRVRYHGQDSLRVEIKGYAREINSGLTTRRSQKPTILEHLYHDQRISFFVSVLISFISLLWSVRSALIQPPPR